MKYYFTKKDGKIISKFPPLPDGEYQISKSIKKRTHSQNRFYFGYVLKFIILQYKEFGYIYTTENLHTIFKKAFIPKKRIKSDFSNKCIYVMGSTSDLNSNQFGDYIERIKAIFEFGEMEKLGLEKIDSFFIPDIYENELLEWEKKII